VVNGRNCLLGVHQSDDSGRSETESAWFRARTLLDPLVAKVVRICRLCKEEAHHLAGGIGACGIGEAAIRTAARPGVPGTMDEPLLEAGRSALVSDRRSGVGAATAYSRYDFPQVTIPGVTRRHYPRRVRRMDSEIRIAVQDDGTDTGCVLGAASTRSIPGDGIAANADTTSLADP